MSGQSWDPDPEAGEALRSAVDSYGPSVLSNPQMLSNLFKDLLPDSPRQAFLLVTTAESDVAGLLQQRFAQRMNPANALRAVATALSESRALELPACLWATAEFARVLGYPVPDGPAGPTPATRPPAEPIPAIRPAEPIPAIRPAEPIPAIRPGEPIPAVRPAEPIPAIWPGEPPTVGPALGPAEDPTVGPAVERAPIGSTPPVWSAETVIGLGAGEESKTIRRTQLLPLPADLTPAPGRPDRPSAAPAGPGRSRWRVAVFAVALLTLAVAVVVVVVQLDSGGHPAGIGVPRGSRLVFEDKFSNPASGWAPDANQPGAGTGAYVAGAYKLTALQPNQPYNTFSAHSPYTPKLTSMAVTVNATIDRGAPADGAGVRCDQGSRNGLRYTFELHGDGTWVIFQLGDPAPYPLLQGSNAAVRGGNRQNTITGQCTEVAGGSTRLTMAVNGVVVGTVVNPHGQAPIAWHGALIIYRTLASPATEVRFSDFRTYRVQPA